MTSKTIDEFDGDYRFLSNFDSCKMHAEFDGKKIDVPTLEHAYQAGKARTWADFLSVCQAPTPLRSKRIGRKIRCVPAWDETKVGFMYNLLKIKFEDPKLRKKLLDTGDAELIEGNFWHDTFWGKCECVLHKGEGKNQLGKLLMKVRRELKG